MAILKKFTILPLVEKTQFPTFNSGYD